MENNKKTILWRYLICLGVASVLVVVVFAIGGFFQGDTKDDMRLLHDAFFSAGALMVLFSGLLYVSGEGAFLGVGYVFGWAIRALIPFSKKPLETYAEYRERKMSKEKKKNDCSIFFVGLLFILISLIFLAIWYQL